MWLRQGMASEYYQRCASNHFDYRDTEHKSQKEEGKRIWGKGPQHTALACRARVIILSTVPSFPSLHLSSPAMVSRRVANCTEIAVRCYIAELTLQSAIEVVMHYRDNEMDLAVARPPKSMWRVSKRREFLFT